jgi:hypothetical protein
MSTNAPTSNNGQRPAPKPFQLKISRGKSGAAERLLVYGSAGIGKSTLAANAPNPIFLDLEGGSSQLDVARAEGLNRWEELLGAVQSLTTDAHDFETVVVDTLDRAEWLCWQSVCERAKVRSIEQIGGGWNKGYTAAYEEFRRLFGALETLWRQRRMRIIVLAHAALETVKNPSGPDYQRYTLKVHKQVAGLFYEACDATLFAHYDVAVTKDEGASRGKASTLSDVRYVYTVEQATHLAKNRYGLPARMPLSWDALAEGIARGHNPELLRETIRARARRLGPETAAKVEANVAHAGDHVAALVALLARVNARLAEQAARAEAEAPPAEATNTTTTDTTTTTTTNTENAR